MIELSDKIKSDLSSSVVNLEYLLVIDTEPTINIATTKQMIPEALYIPTVYGEEFIGEDWFENVQTNHTVNSDGSVTFNSAYNYIDLSSYFQASDFDGHTVMTVQFNITNIDNAMPSNASLTRAFSMSPDYDISEGFNSIDMTNPYPLSYLGIVFNWSQGATLSNLSIRKREIEEQLSDSVYYNDLDFKVSAISSKIDLKTKKVQYADMSFTLSNTLQNEGYLSDRLEGAVGSNCNLYVKSQSCDVIDDSLFVASLKITRIESDDNIVRISANDTNIEGLYTKLPKMKLMGNFNTIEKYNQKPVPILYGHMEEAPAVIYYHNMNSDGRLLVDDSYFSNQKEIEGIKEFYQEQGTLGNYTYRNFDYLVSPNCVKVKIGDHVCDIPCLPFINSQFHQASWLIDSDWETFDSPQYDTFHDYVNLNRKFGVFRNPLKNTSVMDKHGALFVSYVANAELAEEKIFQYYRYGVEEKSNAGAGITSQFLQTAYNDDGTYNEDDTNNGEPTFKAFVQVYNFENVSDANKLDHTVNDKDVFPCDTHFLGNLEFTPTDHGGASGTNKVNIFGIFTPINIDPDPAADHYADSSNFGSPDDFRVWGNLVSVVGAMQNNTWALQHLRMHAPFQIASQYFSYHLAEEMAQYSGEPMFTSFIQPNQSGLDKGVDSNALSLYYMADNNTNSVGTNEDPETESETDTRVYIDTDSGQSDWEDLVARKTWAEKSIYKNDFYVNAKGRIAKNREYTNVDKIRAQIKIHHEAEDGWVDTIDGNIPAEGTKYENKHQNKLFRILTDKKRQRRIINGEVYDLMIHTQWYNTATQELEDKFLFDISVNNMNWNREIESSGTHHHKGGVVGMDNSEYQINHDQGWIYDITAKNYGGSAPNVDASSEYGGFSWFNLVWGKIVWENNTTISEIDYISPTDKDYISDGDDVVNDPEHPEYGQDIYTDVHWFNSTNGSVWMDAWVDDGGTFQTEWISYNPEDWLGTETFDNYNNFGGTSYGLSEVVWNTSNQSEDIESAYKLCDNAPEIIEDLLTTELNYGINTIDEEKYQAAFEEANNIKMAFSINEKKESREILEEICRQSPLTFRYRNWGSEAVLDVIKNQYSDSDIDKELNLSNMYSYSFTKTKIEDLCIGGCVMNYGWNPGSEETKYKTEIKMEDESLVNYKSYYGIRDEDNYVLEFNAPYIDDLFSARKFAAYLFNYYKNQHTIVKLSIPTKDGLELEIGDVIKISTAESAFSEQLNNTTIIIDQERYPYFYITSKKQTLEKIDLECVQLHNLS